MDAGAEAIYRRIREVAKSCGITYYSVVSPLAGLDMGSQADRNRLSDVLDEINMNELQENNDGPLLSAVVVLKDKNIPGDGFFKLARELGRYDGNDDLMFWLKEVRRVHDHYAIRS
jgi:hypothetical protein